eukprot:XP_011669721.1 PREDICTED: uncharacterized protein LOC105440850 [Strongylocentrotus purpuratus]
MLLYSKPQSYDIADDRQRVLYNVPRAQRTGRSDFRHNDGSEQYRLPSYLFDSETDSSDRTSDITEEDRHMQQLAEVITQSPYLNERMRSQITDIAGRSGHRPPQQSEFVRPYVASGREAEFLSTASESGDIITHICDQAK